MDKNEKHLKPIKNQEPSEEEKRDIVEDIIFEEHKLEEREKEQRNLEIGKRIKQLIRNKGITQVEFAWKLGVNPSNIAKWTDGSYLPSADTLLAMAKITGISIDWILTGKEKTPSITIDNKDYPVSIPAPDGHLSSREEGNPVKPKQNDLKSIGGRLRSIRKSLRLDKEEMANLLGIAAPSTVSEYEINQIEPSLAIVDKYAQIGKVSPLWILSGIVVSGITGTEKMTLELKEVQRIFHNLTDEEIGGAVEILRAYERSITMPRTFYPRDKTQPSSED